MAAEYQELKAQMDRIEGMLSQLVGCGAPVVADDVVDLRQRARLELDKELAKRAARRAKK